MAPAAARSRVPIGIALGPMQSTHVSPQEAPHTAQKKPRTGLD